MILWLDPFSGLSGDMLLGALLGLGAPVEDVRAAVRSTGIDGWDLQHTTVTRGGLTATRAVVTTTDTATTRGAAELLDIVGRARPAAVAHTATRAVRAIAEVEAALHAVPVDEVHLHEIGGIDTVVDTVGVAAALHLLDVTAVHCGPVSFGGGTISTRHGTLPVEAPATVELLTRAGAPVVGTGVHAELVTPTGAALLLAADTRFGPLPPMALGAVGYGAGARDVDGRANVLRALLDTGAENVETMRLLETNVDDVTGELLAHLLTRLLATGAADAWLSPIVMKKGRPAHTVHVLVRPEEAAACEQVLLTETGSLGVRRTDVSRVALSRHTDRVVVDGHAIRVKHGPWGCKPEHDDVAAAATALGLPLRVVAERARILASRG
ncbi:nickel pincer cofactor biosynthesis protein LarC [Mycolicibacterium thermoresistibile]